MANPYEAYQQMADTLKEAGTDLSGGKTYSEKNNQSSAPDTSPRPRARPAFIDDDDDDNKNTLTVINEDSGESDSISISNADLESSLSDTEGNFIGTVNLKDGKIDFEKKFVDLYSGGLYDEGLKILPGVKYGDTVTGNKGIKFKTGVGEVHADVDIDAYDAVMRGGDVSGEANLNFVFRPQSIFTNRAKGGSTSDKTPVQMEMDLILSETKDPVSGNTAPLGATPEEVRDDIPINASPNEFVINAATRRYYGTEFFEELQKSAAEGWKRIKDGKESYFRDDELDVEDDSPEINMAPGGTVPKKVPEPTGGGYGGYGGAGPLFRGFELVDYVDANDPNKRIKIAFFMGRPITRIPPNFVEQDKEAAEIAAEQTTPQGDPRDRRELGYDLETTYRNKNVDDWSGYDYGQYYSDIEEDFSKGKNITELNNVEKFITGITGIGFLGGNLAGGLLVSNRAKNFKKEYAVKIFNKTSELMKLTGEEKLSGEHLKTVQYTNYMLGKSLGKYGDDVKEPEKPDVSLLSKYANEKTPESGLDFNPNTSMFQTQYDRDEALAGTFGNRAAYLASQEVHSQGLRAKDPSLGIEDTSYFGSNVGPVEAITNLFTTGTVQGDDNNDNNDSSSSASSTSSSGTSSQTFSEAFADAREEQGAGGTFEYQGSTYTTDYADEN